RRIRITVFDASSKPILQGERTVDLAQAVEAIDILLLLLPEAADLENQTFTFADGAIFGLVGQEVRLTFGTFTGNSGPVSLTVMGKVAHGTARIASIDFDFQQSDIPTIVPGSTFSFEATINEDGGLTLRDRETGVSSTSTPPIPITVGDLRIEQIV